MPCIRSETELSSTNDERKQSHRQDRSPAIAQVARDSLSITTQWSPTGMTTTCPTQNEKKSPSTRSFHTMVDDVVDTYSLALVGEPYFLKKVETLSDITNMTLGLSRHRIEMKMSPKISLCLVTTMSGTFTKKISSVRTAII